MARLRQAQKLLRLAERYGAARVNAACARALAFELLDGRRVEGIVRTALERRAEALSGAPILALTVLQPAEEAVGPGGRRLVQLRMDRL